MDNTNAWDLARQFAENAGALEGALEGLLAVIEGRIDPGDPHVEIARRVLAQVQQHREAVRSS